MFPNRTCTALLALALGLVIGCSGRPQPKNEDPIHLKGAGASFPTVLYRHWFKTFDEKDPDVSIEYESVGSGEGVTRFLGKDPEGRTVDFGASDNGLSDEEAKQVERGVQQLPTAAGMICIVYNIPGIDNLRLSRKAYTDIFRKKITKWNDPVLVDDNPGVELPDRDIAVVVRQDGSGTTYHFSNHLSAVSAEWREKYGTRKLIAWPAGVLPRRGNEGVGGEVKRSPGTIGYVDLGTKQAADLKAATLQNLSGDWVEPTVASARKAIEAVPVPSNLRLFLPDPETKGAYPIVGFTYLMLYKKYEDPRRIQSIRRLLEWCLTEGQHDCERLGYVPLAGSVAQAALRAVRTLGQ